MYCAWQTQIIALVKGNAWNIYAHQIHGIFCSKIT